MTNTNIIIDTTTDLDGAFSQLVEQRRVWEAGAFAASNTELYALLGQTLTVLTRIKRSVELSRGLNKLLEQRGFKIKSGTSMEVKLVRAIFVDPENPDRYRNRLFGYARVLNIAHTAGITGKDLPQFITENGGIDELRRHDPSNGNKAEVERARLEQAEQTLKAQAHKCILSGIPLTGDLLPASDQHFSIALVRRDADGTGSIVFGTNSGTLVKEILRIAGRKLDKDAVAENQRARQAEIAAANKAAIAAVAEELSAAFALPDLSPLDELEAELAA